MLLIYKTLFNLHKKFRRKAASAQGTGFTLFYLFSRDIQVNLIVTFQMPGITKHYPN